MIFGGRGQQPSNTDHPRCFDYQKRSPTASSHFISNYISPTANLIHSSSRQRLENVAQSVDDACLMYRLRC